MTVGLLPFEPDQIIAVEERGDKLEILYDAGGKTKSIRIRPISEETAFLLSTDVAALTKTVEGLSQRDMVSEIVNQLSEAAAAISPYETPEEDWEEAPVAAVAKPASRAIAIAPKVQATPKIDSVEAILLRAQSPRFRLPSIDAASEHNLAVCILEMLRGGGPAIVSSSGHLLRYDGQCWQRLSRQDFAKAMVLYDGKHYNNGQMWRRIQISHRLVKATWDHALEFTEDKDFDKKRVPGICFKNGFLSIKMDGSLKFGPHSPDHHATDAVDYDYNPKAPYDLWLKALNTAWDGCPDIKQRSQLLAELVGSALFGEGYRWAKCLVLFGEGSNGKSTVLEVLTELFPKEAVSSVPPQKWSDKDLVGMLAGAKLNVVTELPSKAMIETQLFKDIVDRGRITTHKKYGQPYQFWSIAVNIFSCNNLPDTHDQTLGFWRRLIVLSFPNTIRGNRTKEDVKAEILAQLPGIMIWAIEGASRAFKQGCLTIPSSANEAKDNWQNSSDQLTKFITDCARKVEILMDMTVAQLYPAFVEWCRATGHTSPMTQHTFAVKLGELGYKRRMTSGLSKGQMRLALVLKPRKEWDCRPPSMKEIDDATQSGYVHGLPMLEVN